MVGMNFGYLVVGLALQSYWAAADRAVDVEPKMTFRDLGKGECRLQNNPEYKEPAFLNGQEKVKDVHACQRACVELGSTSRPKCHGYSFTSKNPRCRIYTEGPITVKTSGLLFHSPKCFVNAVLHPLGQIPQMGLPLHAVGPGFAVQQVPQMGLPLHAVGPGVAVQQIPQMGLPLHAVGPGFAVQQAPHVAAQSGRIASASAHRQEVPNEEVSAMWPGPVPASSFPASVASSSASKPSSSQSLSKSGSESVTQSLAGGGGAINYGGGASTYGGGVPQQPPPAVQHPPAAPSERPQQEFALNPSSWQVPPESKHNPQLPLQNEGQPGRQPSNRHEESKHNPQLPLQNEGQPGRQPSNRHEESKHNPQLPLQNGGQPGRQHSNRHEVAVGLQPPRATAVFGPPQGAIGPPQGAIGPPLLVMPQARRGGSGDDGFPTFGKAKAKVPDCNRCALERGAALVTFGGPHAFAIAVLVLFGVAW